MMKCLHVKISFKKCLVSLFSLCFVFSGMGFISFAESVSIGDVTYEFNTTDDGIALYKITSTKDITKLELPDQFDGRFITKIMGYRNESGLFGAFQNLANLEEIVVPDGVTTIGTHAFRNCAKLKFVTLPKSVKVIDICAFMNCSSLQSIYLPEGVDRVKYNAFAGCINLKEIHARYGVTFDAEALVDNARVVWY